MASRTGKTLVLAILGLMVAATAVACSRGASSDAVRSSLGASGTTPNASSPGAVDPVPTAAPGMPLERLTSPPERSLWALSADSYDEGVEIEVEFEPYGVGPSAYGESVVALVTNATTDGSGRAPDLEGRNVVFIVGDQVVDVGGRHSGTAVVSAQGDRLYLRLARVQPGPES